jgi:hypothetical protein
MRNNDSFAAFVRGDKTAPFSLNFRPAKIARKNFPFSKNLRVSREPFCAKSAIIVANPIFHKSIKTMGA